MEENSGEEDIPDANPRVAHWRTQSVTSHFWTAYLEDPAHRCLLVAFSNTSLVDKESVDAAFAWFGTVNKVRLTDDRRVAFIDFACEHGPLLFERCYKSKLKTTYDELKQIMPKNVDGILPGCSIDNFLFLYDVPPALSTAILHHHFIKFFNRDNVIIHRPGSRENGDLSTQVVVELRDGTTGASYHQEKMRHIEIAYNGRNHMFYVVPPAQLLMNSSGVFDSGQCEDCNLDEFSHIFVKKDKKMEETEASVLKTAEMCAPPNRNYDDCSTPRASPLMLPAVSDDSEHTQMARIQEKRNEREVAGMSAKVDAPVNRNDHYSTPTAPIPKFGEITEESERRRWGMVTQKQVSHPAVAPDTVVQPPVKISATVAPPRFPTQSIPPATVVPHSAKINATVPATSLTQPVSFDTTVAPPRVPTQSIPPSTVVPPPVNINTISAPRLPRPFNATVSFPRLPPPSIPPATVVATSVKTNSTVCAPRFGPPATVYPPLPPAPAPARSRSPEPSDDRDFEENWNDNLAEWRKQEEQKKKEKEKKASRSFILKRGASTGFPSGPFDTGERWDDVPAPAEIKPWTKKDEYNAWTKREEEKTVYSSQTLLPSSLLPSSSSPITVPPPTPTPPPPQQPRVQRPQMEQQRVTESQDIRQASRASSLHSSSQFPSPAPNPAPPPKAILEVHRPSPSQVATPAPLEGPSDFSPYPFPVSADSHEALLDSDYRQCEGGRSKQRREERHPFEGMEFARPVFRAPQLSTREAPASAPRAPEVARDARERPFVAECPDKLLENSHGEFTPKEAKKEETIKENRTIVNKEKTGKGFGSSLVVQKSSIYDQPVTEKKEIGLVPGPSSSSTSSPFQFTSISNEGYAPQLVFDYRRLASKREKRRLSGGMDAKRRESSEQVLMRPRGDVNGCGNKENGQDSVETRFVREKPQRSEDEVMEGREERGPGIDPSLGVQRSSREVCPVRERGEKTNQAIVSTEEVPRVSIEEKSVETDARSTVAALGGVSEETGDVVVEKSVDSKIETIDNASGDIEQYPPSALVSVHEMVDDTSDVIVKEEDVEGSEEGGGEEEDESYDGGPTMYSLNDMVVMADETQSSVDVESDHERSFYSEYEKKAEEIDSDDLQSGEEDQWRIVGRKPRPYFRLSESRNERAKDEAYVPTPSPTVLLNHEDTVSPMDNPESSDDESIYYDTVSDANTVSDESTNPVFVDPEEWDAEDRIKHGINRLSAIEEGSQEEDAYSICSTQSSQDVFMFEEEEKKESMDGDDPTVERQKKEGDDKNGEVMEEEENDENTRKEKCEYDEEMTIMEEKVKEEEEKSIDGDEKVNEKEEEMPEREQRDDFSLPQSPGFSTSPRVRDSDDEEGDEHRASLLSSASIANIEDNTSEEEKMEVEQRDISTTSSECSRRSEENSDDERERKQRNTDSIRSTQSSQDVLLFEEEEKKESMDGEGDLTEKIQEKEEEVVKKEENTLKEECLYDEQVSIVEEKEKEEEKKEDEDKSIDGDEKVDEEENEVPQGIQRDAFSTPAYPPQICPSPSEKDSDDERRVKEEEEERVTSFPSAPIAGLDATEIEEMKMEQREVSTISSGLLCSSRSEVIGDEEREEKEQRATVNSSTSNANLHVMMNANMEKEHRDEKEDVHINEELIDSEIEARLLKLASWSELIEEDPPSALAIAPKMAVDASDVVVQDSEDRGVRREDEVKKEEYDIVAGVATADANLDASKIEKMEMEQREDITSSSAPIRRWSRKSVVDQEEDEDYRSMGSEYNDWLTRVDVDSRGDSMAKDSSDSEAEIVPLPSSLPVLTWGGPLPEQVPESRPLEVFGRVVPTFARRTTTAPPATVPLRTDNVAASNRVIHY